jgi:hypothetical protein
LTHDDVRGRSTPATMRRRAAAAAAVLGVVLVVAGACAATLVADTGAAVSTAFFLFVSAVVAWAAAFVLASPAGRRRGAFVALVVALCLGVVEAVSHPLVGARFAALYRPHDVWLYEHVPSAHHVATFDDFAGGRTTIDFDVDSDGFRGPELLPAGAARRVVVYGDSFVAAHATRWEDTFVRRLGDRLTAALRTNVEAIDAGVAGYGPDQACLRMEVELPRLRPDLVVVALCAQNDYGDVVRNRVFSLDPSGATRRERPTLGPLPRADFAAAASSFLLPRLALAAWQRVRTWRFGEFASVAPCDSRPEVLAACGREVAYAVRGGLVVNDVLWDHVDADIRLVPESPSAKYKIQLMSAVMQEIRDVARRNGTPLLFVVIPYAPDVCVDYDYDLIDPAVRPGYARENLTAPMTRIAAALDAPCVDLFEPFRAAGAGALYRRGGDTHWNAAGQSLAAERAAQVVLERALMK